MGSWISCNLCSSLVLVEVSIKSRVLGWMVVECERKKIEKKAREGAIGDLDEVDVLSLLPRLTVPRGATTVYISSLASGKPSNRAV